MQELTTQQAGALRPLADLETTIRAAAVFELQGALTVGVCLMEAKQQLGRGEWLPWLRKMGISSSYAERRMKLAAEIPPESALNSLNYTQAMAVLALPAGEREAFVIENDAQEKSAAEIKRLIAERDAQMRRAEILMSERDSERSRADTLAKSFSTAREQADALEKQLQMAEAHTVKVVEVPDDYQQLKQAAARHQTEMDEAVQAAKEAETRAAAAEAELSRLRRQAEGQAPDEYTAAQGAVNTFLMQVQLLPYNRQAFASLYDRQRFGELVKAVRDWADEMADALASVGLDGEGAVV